MTAPFATSPLAHREPLAAANAAWLRETPFLGLLSLRGEPDIIGDKARKALGAPLPSGPGETAEAGETVTLWLAPDEWVIVTPPGGEADLLPKLEKSLAGTHHQLVDVSDYYTAIDIGGEAAWRLLSKLIAIDLHPRAFTPGTAVATLCAKANVWLWLTRDADGPVFRLFTRRSHADYVWCLLAEAGREWGLPAEEPVGQVRLHLPHLSH